MFNKPRLLTPGPTPLPEVVRLALSKDMIHHRKSDFKKIMHDLKEKTGLLFGTKGPVLPLACSGTGAMTAAVYSLFAPGEKVLVIEGGKFGERWAEIAKSRGLEVEILHVEWGKAVNPDEVANKANSNPDIKGVLVQLCETSTGVLHPVREIAELITNPMIIVDGISAVGISPCSMDDWNLDCLLTGSQKGLMLPPGLTLLALSDRAWKKAQSIPPGCFYFNLPQERNNLEKDQTYFTTPINLIYGLEASLDLILQTGLPKLYQKQWALTMLVRAGINAMGLKLFVEENFSWGVTSVNVPTGIDGQTILKIIEQKYGVIMAGGQDRLKGKIIRVGHMGWIDWSDCLAGLYALYCALKESGAKLSNSAFLEQAMSEYNKALAVSLNNFI